MKKSALITIVVLIGLVVAGVWLLRSDWYKAQGVSSFTECVEAGFPVMESYPRQCRAGEKLFVEGEDPEGEEGDGIEEGLPEPVETSLIRVDSPLPGATISSPLVVRGEARGQWYFEADFPVRLLDATGRELAVVPAQAQGEWMTTDFVPFEALLNFATSTTDTGFLVLEKSNPSGLPENADEVRVPVRFSATSARERSLVLYYYDEERDEDASGNIQCSAEGLVGVRRTMPVSMTPIQDTIRLLIRGELSASERASGVSTEFPLQGLSLTGASLEGGVLTLGFSDPENRTSGGACRASILRLQIESTAKQFAGVNSVRFEPEDLFQP